MKIVFKIIFLFALCVASLAHGQGVAVRSFGGDVTNLNLYATPTGTTSANGPWSGQFNPLLIQTNTMFISTNGNDATAVLGNPNQPWRHGAVALNNSSPGYTLQFGPGTFSDAGESITQPQSLMNWTNVTIKGAGRDSTFWSPIFMVSPTGNHYCLSLSGSNYLSDITIKSSVFIPFEVVNGSQDVVNHCRLEEDGNILGLGALELILGDDGNFNSFSSTNNFLAIDTEFVSGSVNSLGGGSTALFYDGSLQQAYSTNVFRRCSFKMATSSSAVSSVTANLPAPSFSPLIFIDSCYVNQTGPNAYIEQGNANVAFVNTTFVSDSAAHTAGPIGTPNVTFSGQFSHYLNCQQIYYDNGAYDVVTNVVTGVYAGSGAGLTNLNASSLSSGTLPFSTLPGYVVTNNLAPIFTNGGWLITNVSGWTFQGTNGLFISSNTVDSSCFTIDTNRNFTWKSNNIITMSNGIAGGTLMTSNLVIWGGGPQLFYQSGFWDFRPLKGWSVGGLQFEDFSSGGGFVLASGNYAGGSAGASIQVQRTGVVLFDSVGGVTMNQTLSVIGTSSLDNGAITTDGSGDMTVLGLNVEANGISDSGALTVTGPSSLDNAHITSDGSGNLTVNSITIGGVFSAAGNSIGGDALGNLSAVSFNGSGAGLNHIPASQLNGTIPQASLPNFVITNANVTRFTNAAAFTNTSTADITGTLSGYGGIANYTTNFLITFNGTTFTANGYTNTTGRSQYINVFGTAGSNIFLMRGGAHGTVVASVPIFTNINTANGGGYALGVNCGVQVVNGANVRLQVYDSP